MEISKEMTRCMEREERKAFCADLKKSFNCAQAVALGFTDAVDLDVRTVERCALGYGGGLGNRQGTCGAIVGAGLIVGLASGSRDEARTRMGRIMTRFQERNGATQCSRLKGLDGGPMLRRCPDCVADAAEFLYDELADMRGE